MNRYEFLTQLEEQLRGFVSNQEVRESVQYYQGYIEEEMRKGFTEEEVLEELGSANSIAKAIIEARGHEADTDTVYEQAGDRYEEAPYQDNPYQRENPHSSVKVFRTDGWKGTAVLVGIIVVLILLLVFAFKIMVAVLPYVIPFALILFLIKMVTGKR